jgi:hypothetical protein
MNWRSDSAEYQLYREAIRLAWMRDLALPFK